MRMVYVAASVLAAATAGSPGTPRTLAAQDLEAAADATRDPADAVDADDIDRTIESLRAEFGIPGVAVAVVRGDSVAHARGYGVRRMGGDGGEERRDGGKGHDGPVDEHTLFAIGSATKAFTATLIGTLVDQGLLGWDDRVADRLPGFRLRDPATTAGLTIRDLLAHRSGLPPANLMWLTAESTDADTLLRRLRELEPAAGFRSAFTYQNLLYVAAGRITEEASGRSWDALLAERLLGPLGMVRTTATPGGLVDRPNVATPHVLVDGAARPVPFREIDHVGPAGSIHSSAADMARWLRFLLAGGAWDGERLIEAATLAETTTPQMVVPADPVMAAFHPAARLQAYGMGWFISDFHGMTLLAHGGGIDGMSALVAWVPEAGLGIALLTNLQTSTPPTWIFGMLYDVLDAALGVEPTDWRAPAASLDAMFTEMMGRGVEPERVAGTRPSHGLDAYAGTWTKPTLGEARIALEDGRLVFRHGTLEGTLEHWHYDTFRVRWEDVAWRAAAGSGWITFRLDRSGAPAELELVAIPGETEQLVRAD